MSNQNEQRLSQLVESNNNKLLKVTGQLQRLQQVQTAELQLQQQTKEFQQQHEQQVHALNTLEQKIKALQTPSHVQNKTQEDIVGTFDWCMKWAKKIKPYMMVIVVYMILRKR